MDYLYNNLNKNTPQIGSIYYYAYRRCEKNVIEILYTLDQLKYQWFKTSELYSEIYPNIRKLEWWGKAFESIDSSKHHPIIQILLKHFSMDTLQPLLKHDLEYSLTTLIEKRHYQNNLDLSMSFIGIATLKAKVLSFEDKKQIKILNNLDEILRHILLIRNHYARNIILDKAFHPAMDEQTFKQTLKNILIYMQKLKLQLKLPTKMKPLILLNKQQELCVKKFTKKLSNPFQESIHISPFSLLFSTIFTKI